MHTQLFAGECIETSVTDHRGLHLDSAEAKVGVSDFSLGIGRKDPNVGHRSRLGVLTTVVRLDNRDMVVEIKIRNPPRGSLMQVNRTRMDETERA